MPDGVYNIDIENKSSSQSSGSGTITTAAGSDFRDKPFFPAGMQPAEVAYYLDTDITTGLSHKEHKARFRQFGQNIIYDELKLSFFQSLKSQIKGLLSPLLIISSLLLYGFDPQPSYLALSGVICLFMLINALLESRAAGALNLPRAYTAIKAALTRGGTVETDDARTLVPGDIITLSEGMVVPCDARLFESDALCILETPVSGRQGSVQKDFTFLAESDDGFVYENMVYAGTIVASGRGSAIVCATGKETIIRRMSRERSDHLPALLKYVQKTAKYLSIAAVTVCLGLIIAGVTTGYNIEQLFIVSLSISVVSLSDSMSALTAASFGYGIKKMSKYGAVVRNMSCIDQLCTLNTIMCAKNVIVPPNKMSVSGIFCNNTFFAPDSQMEDCVPELLYFSLACSDIKLRKKYKKGEKPYIGKLCDESAAEFLCEKGYGTDEVGEFFRLKLDFSPTGEVIGAIVLYKGKNLIIRKGAPEYILEKSIGYEQNGVNYKMNKTARRRILAQLDARTKETGFVLAIAAGETRAESLLDPEAERGLIFKGFIIHRCDMSMDVAAAVYKCKNAGIEAILNCPDSYYSSLNTAKNAGLITCEEQITTSEQMELEDIGLFIANCPDYKLFLHLTDAQWRRILEYRKADKKNVAVTAERISELPLMYNADISFVPYDCADTLKQSADVLMLRSGFEVICGCIQNARLIFKRIHAVIEYLTVCPAILFFTTLLSLIFGLTLPFRVQDILFGGIIINFLFAIALAFTPPERNLIYKKTVRYKKKPSPADFAMPLLYALGASVCIIFISLSQKNNLAVLFCLTLVLFLYAQNNVSRVGFFREKIAPNPFLYLSFALSLSFSALLALYPPLSGGFDYGLPSYIQIGITTLCCGVYFILTQAVLMYYNTKNERKQTQWKK